MADKIVAGKRRKRLEDVKRRRKFDSMRLLAEKRRKTADGPVNVQHQVVQLSSDEEAGETEDLFKLNKEDVVNQEINKIKPITR